MGRAVTCERCRATRREVCSTGHGESLCLDCYAAGTGGARASDPESATWERDRKSAAARGRRRPDDVDRLLARLRRVGRVEYLAAELVAATCPACRETMRVRFGAGWADPACLSGCSDATVDAALGRVR